MSNFHSKTNKLQLIESYQAESDLTADSAENRFITTGPIRNQLRSREIENSVKIVSEIFLARSERAAKFDDLSAGTFCRDRSFLNTCALRRIDEITSPFGSQSRPSSHLNIDRFGRFSDSP